MTQPVERLINLAMYLAASSAPVTTVQIREEVTGYPTGQDDAAFERMFERDKGELRAAGLHIESDAEGRNSLDVAATFASEVPLSPAEAASVRAVGVALLDDPGFPFAGELRFALAKIATALEVTGTPVTARMTDERPADQGAAVALLDRAATQRKRVSFRYVNSLGESKSHTVEPFGLFARDGRWYVVARDPDLDEARTYAVSRMSELTANSSKPSTPDFDRPADFDVASFIGLPFQYGPDVFEAELTFDAGCAWRARPLTDGAGQLETLSDSSARWRVGARDRQRLMQWVIENGPGITIESPDDLAEEMSRLLGDVASQHGSPPEHGGR